MDVQTPLPVDAQPFLRPDPGSVWRRSNETRDAIYETIDRLTRELGFDVLVNRSPDFVFPNWASMHAWLPADAPGVTLRVGLVVELHILPQHRFDIIYVLKAIKNDREHVCKFLTSWDEGFLLAWLVYLLQDGPKPAWRGRKIREDALAFWMPKNKMELVRSRRVPRRAIGWIAILLGVICLFAATQGDTPPWDSIAGWMYDNGLMPGGITWADVPRIFVEYAAGLLVGGILLLVLTARRRMYHMSSDRPQGQPRQLRTADSWSALLPRIGGQQDEARTRFLAALRGSAGDKRTIAMETISYVTPNGKREREQIVLAEGRAILFCHLYTYEQDLLIGWDAHLNLGEWVEKRLATGIHRTLERPVVLYTVVPGTARPNEYDLIDLNSLTDWAHSHLVRIVKALIAENRLDEEIDFTIVRTERNGLLAEPAAEQPRKSRFRRAA